MFEDINWAKTLDYLSAFFFVLGLVFWLFAGVLDISGTVLFDLWSARHFAMDAGLSFLASISAGVGAVYHKGDK